MAAYANSTLEQDASAEDIQSLMVEKATDLFMLCDLEQKGFITKRDMQRLQTELPLNPEQLEDVFDSLDDDGNGYLTLQEFIEGFGEWYNSCSLKFFYRYPAHSPSAKKVKILITCQVQHSKAILSDLSLSRMSSSGLMVFH